MFWAEFQKGKDFNREITPTSCIIYEFPIFKLFYRHFKVLIVTNTHTFINYHLALVACSCSLRILMCFLLN